jgi:hypothetical protein
MRRSVSQRDSGHCSGYQSVHQKSIVTRKLRGRHLTRRIGGKQVHWSDGDETKTRYDTQQAEHSQRKHDASEESANSGAKKSGCYRDLRAGVGDGLVGSLRQSAASSVIF